MYHHTCLNLLLVLCYIMRGKSFFKNNIYFIFSYVSVCVYGYMHLGAGIDKARGFQIPRARVSTQQRYLESLQEQQAHLLSHLSNAQLTLNSKTPSRTRLYKLGTFGTYLQDRTNQAQPEIV